MRIALIAPLAERVPPKKYGGTERVIDQMAKGLVNRGHDVTMFASGDSQTPAKLISVIPKSLREIKSKDVYGYNIHSLINMGLAYSMQKQFDIIHDHNPHMGLPTANIATTPVVATWHGPFDPEMSSYFARFNRPYIISISEAQQKLARNVNFVGNVYHGMDMKHYPFSEKPDKYLLFVGRFSPEKGPHHAIAVAKKLKIPLILAAKLEKGFAPDENYFYKHIKPHLNGGLIRWVGEVDEKKRNKLMSKAMAFLHPVTWPEPFGLVLIESMACGTPPVAFKQGSIPEVIDHGKTGLVTTNVKEMVSAVKNIGKVSREHCRSRALEFYSQERMAEDYEAMYNKILTIEKLKKQLVPNEQPADRQKLLLEFRTRNT